MGILRDHRASGEQSSESGRTELVRATTERVASLLGIGGATVHASDELKEGCRLTSSGIELMVNPALNEQAALLAPMDSRARNERPDGAVLRARQGVKGHIGVEEFDLVTACLLSLRAHDFLDASFGDVPFENPSLSDASKRYLTASIDALAAEQKARKLPFVAQCHEAYISRHEIHFMQGLPLQQQLMKALRLYLFEEEPILMTQPAVVEWLGTTVHASSLVERVRNVLESDTLGYRQRHARMRELLEEPFSAAARLDAATLPYCETLHLFDDDNSYATSQNAVNDRENEQEEFEAALRSEKKLETVTEQNIDQLIADTGESALPDETAPSLRIPDLCNDADAIALPSIIDEEYDRTVSDGKHIIEELADLFIRIAQPQELLSVPRYDPRCFAEGTRLNPRAMRRAFIQLETGESRAVWQRVRRIGRFQSKTFNGLDVMLAIDVSFSMRGERGRCAATTATYLAESLQRAYERCIAAHDGATVDVRTQLLAFGEGWAPLTPLSTTHTDDDKRRAFRAIAYPASNQTLVGGALGHVKEHALVHPDRETLCLVISDGLFADNLRARKIALALPSNVHLGHVNIGRFSGVPLTGNYESVPDPKKLPEKLENILRARLDRQGA